MRELKFRAWNTVAKRMSAPFRLPGYRLPKDGGFPADECEVMQYTGLKDKNGVEIYEGDIIHRINASGAFANNFTVKWYATDSGFRIKTVDGMNAKNLEVIGNIWENGDLLK